MLYNCTICGYVSENIIPDICPVCENSNSFVEQNKYILQYLSCSNELINEMEKLRSKDIIEYELKMSQFRHQYEQKIEYEISKKRATTNPINIPKCPTCESTNIEKITAGQKALGAIGFGLLSKTARSTFKCKNCGHKW